MVGQGAGRGYTGYRHTHGDIFPALGAFVGAGLVLGVTAVLILATLGLTRGRGLQLECALGGTVGAILGFFVGLGRGVGRPGPLLRTPEPAHEPPPQLWDPWLDSGHEELWTEPAVVVEEPAILAGQPGEPAVKRAGVRPRVISPTTHEAVLLEDEIGPLIQEGASGLVQIVGGPGSGKSTALRHLAAILPPWTQQRVRFVDEHDGVPGSTDAALTIFAGHEPPQSSRLAVFGLAPWGQDDVIEYLLATHREQCASVMTRLKRGGNYSFLRGTPELWTVVLDLMAADESVADVRSALRRELATQLDDRRMKTQVEALCLRAIQRIFQVDGTTPTPNLSADEAAHLSLDVELFRLIRHQPVMVLLAADRLVQLAECGRADGAFVRQLPRELISETGRRLHGNAQALQHLATWINQTDRHAMHPTVASLLHAGMRGWRPDPSCHPGLAGAYLDGAGWAGVNLSGINLQSVDLNEADLCGANLERADARGACFCHANFHGANLTSSRLDRADLSHAKLQGSTAKHVRFEQTNLGGAVLIDADLTDADLRNANIDQTDFRAAKLEGACLTGLDLRAARFEGARCAGADLRFCNLEEMQLTAPDFHGAKLLNALLTGSAMPGANFVGADLRNAGLADVAWPRANLRNADLRGASFHLGSARNGLVGSTIACEGSRTGFYTDDYNDQNVKPAEEIRKANLRGADLRGANIQDVDFYLVDLRDAEYTPDQAEHLRHCRAILQDRTSE